MKLLRIAGFCFASASAAFAQSISLPWSGHGHDPQHTAVSKAPSQPLGRIKWQMLIDQNRQYGGGNGNVLFIHYGAPLITRQNTVIVPVKTGADDGFRIEARDPANGALKWTQTTDYSLPAHAWTPAYGIALTPKNRVYFPGAGGTVYYRDSPDEASGPTGQLAFYGMANYLSGKSAFDANVRINTPITSDRYGNIYFGFVVSSPTSNPSLQSGLARIGEDGVGSWVSAQTASADPGISKLVNNCAPALSNDQKTVYFGVNFGQGFTGGYLVSLNSRTLAPGAQVRLKDLLYTGQDAYMTDNGSTSPTVGPDGDVYYGVLENNFGSNNGRGYLLHFDSSLTQAKPAASFGWDDTPSIVPSSFIPSYQGTSEYLLLIKYNNYAGFGSGDGKNKLAVVDPNATMSNPINGVTVMNEVFTILSPTPDSGITAQWPGAVREWCINSAAVDPITKSALASCEDGKTYRLDFASKSFTEVITLTNGIGEAYTPTVVGVDGTVYAIANGTLFAIGAALP